MRTIETMNERKRSVYGRTSDGHCSAESVIYKKSIFEAYSIRFTLKLYPSFESTHTMQTNLKLINESYASTFSVSKFID